MNGRLIMFLLVSKWCHSQILFFFSDLQPFLISCVFPSLAPITSFSHPDVISSERFCYQGHVLELHVFSPSFSSKYTLQHGTIGQWRLATWSSSEQVKEWLSQAGGSHSFLFNWPSLESKSIWKDRFTTFFGYTEKRLYLGKEKWSYHLYPNRAKLCCKESIWYGFL